MRKFSITFTTNKAGVADPNIQDVIGIETVEGVHSLTVSPHWYDSRKMLGHAMVNAEDAVEAKSILMSSIGVV
jgi:hypothetical protein